MKLRAWVALWLCLSLNALADTEGLIVFDRGVKSSELSPQIILETASTLFTMDPAAEEPEPVLVEGTRDGSANLMASWFPGRNRIAYVSNRQSDGLAQIWTAALGNPEHTAVTDNTGNNLYPVVSPDGEKIAFVSTADIDDGVDEPAPVSPITAMQRTRLDVYIMNSDGTGLHRLTDDNLEDRDPQFSLDGKTVYFVKQGVVPGVRRIDYDGVIGEDASVVDEDAFPINGRDLSVFGDPLGDILYFNNLNNVFTTFDSFTFDTTAGSTGLRYPYVSQDGSRIVHTTGGNLAVAPATGGANLSLLLTGDVTFARWLSPGQEALPRTLEVLSPNGGNKWSVGSTKKIEWTSLTKASDAIKIELSRGGLTPVVLVASTENDGEYDWTIPAAQEVGNDYVITVSFVEDPSIVDSSDHPFTILLPEDCPIPATPTNVIATDGAYRDRVEVYWQAVPGAREYLVYRNRVDSWTTAKLVDTVEENMYVDTDTLPAIIQQSCRGPEEARVDYFYYIRAAGDCGVSELSLAESGYRGVSTEEETAAAASMLLLAAVGGALALAGRVKAFRR